MTFLYLLGQRPFVLLLIDFYTMSGSVSRLLQCGKQSKLIHEKLYREMKDGSRTTKYW